MPVARWALHDAMPERYRMAVLLGAFAGLRAAEACGLRPGDVDFMRGVIRPAVQYPAEELKTDTSRTPLPVAPSLELELSDQVQRWPGGTILTNEQGVQLGPWKLERAIREARAAVDGLPTGFQYHGPAPPPRLAADRVRRGCQDGAGAAATRQREDHPGHLHLWPDRDESTRAAVEAVFRLMRTRRGPGGCQDECCAGQTSIRNYTSK
jgi:hypothetical protein